MIIKNSINELLGIIEIKIILPDERDVAMNIVLYKNIKQNNIDEENWELPSNITLKTFTNTYCVNVSFIVKNNL